ncbi:hypothetical protein TNCV_3658931 [Trichonephila clavipes]|nr:hypothetical protein TNCV_3658931 [Trichonephila clavipes]
MEVSGTALIPPTLVGRQDGEGVTSGSLVYADKPQTLDHLKDNIRRVIADVRPQMLEKVIENWTSRLDYIRASRGDDMPEIIFKIECLLTSHSEATPELLTDGPRDSEPRSSDEVDI